MRKDHICKIVSSPDDASPEIRYIEVQVIENETVDFACLQQRETQRCSSGEELDEGHQLMGEQGGVDTIDGSGFSTGITQRGEAFAKPAPWSGSILGQSVIVPPFDEQKHPTPVF